MQLSIYNEYNIPSDFLLEASRCKIATRFVGFGAIGPCLVQPGLSWGRPKGEGDQELAYSPP